MFSTLSTNDQAALLVRLPYQVSTSLINNMTLSAQTALYESPVFYQSTQAIDAFKESQPATQHAILKELAHRQSDRAKSSDAINRLLHFLEPEQHGKIFALFKTNSRSAAYIFNHMDNVSRVELLVNPSETHTFEQKSALLIALDHDKKIATLNKLTTHFDNKRGSQLKLSTADAPLHSKLFLSINQYNASELSATQHAVLTDPNLTLDAKSDLLCATSGAQKVQLFNLLKSSEKSLKAFFDPLSDNVKTYTIAHMINCDKKAASELFAKLPIDKQVAVLSNLLSDPNKWLPPHALKSSYDKAFIDNQYQKAIQLLMSLPQTDRATLLLNTNLSSDALKQLLDALPSTSKRVDFINTLVGNTPHTTQIEAAGRLINSCDQNTAVALLHNLRTSVVTNIAKYPLLDMGTEATESSYRSLIDTPKLVATLNHDTLFSNRGALIYQQLPDGKQKQEIFDGLDEAKKEKYAKLDQLASEDIVKKELNKRDALDQQRQNFRK